MFPRMYVPAVRLVADCAGRHGPVVQHQVGGSAVAGTQDAAAGLGVQVSVVAYHRRLTDSRIPTGSGPSDLGCDERINLDAANNTLSTVIQRVMVNLARNKESVALFNRIVLAIADQSP